MRAVEKPHADTKRPCSAFRFTMVAQHLSVHDFSKAQLSPNPYNDNMNIVNYLIYQESEVKLIYKS